MRTGVWGSVGEVGNRVAHRRRPALRLDELVAVGALPPERRPGAEVMAWSAVHGLAMLTIEGPLRSLDAEQTRAAAQRVLDMVEQGL
jgi:Tetracyclin repressor-like, C-terminal domain